MTDSKKDKAAELTADDLDMAVGGATLDRVSVVKQEESNKYVKGEEHRKHDLSPREEKAKQG